MRARSWWPGSVSDGVQVRSRSILQAGAPRSSPTPPDHAIFVSRVPFFSASMALPYALAFQKASYSEDVRVRASTDRWAAPIRGLFGCDEVGHGAPGHVIQRSFWRRTGWLDFGSGIGAGSREGPFLASRITSQAGMCCVFCAGACTGFDCFGPRPHLGRSGRSDDVRPSL